MIVGREAESEESAYAVKVFVHYVKSVLTTVLHRPHCEVPNEDCKAAHLQNCELGDCVLNKCTDAKGYDNAPYEENGDENERPLASVCSTCYVKRSVLLPKVFIKYQHGER